MIGDLTVITGTMFSGKSTALIKAGREYEGLGAKVIYCKPQIDTRYSANSIVTHDGTEQQAVILQDFDVLFDAKMFLRLMQADVIVIDEVQFFTDVVSTITRLLKHGKTVLVAGLDLNYLGEPFGQVPTLLSLADEVIKLHAECNYCKAPARYSLKIADGSQIIQLGSSDSYRPVCTKCYLNSEEMMGVE